MKLKRSSAALSLLGIWEHVVIRAFGFSSAVYPKSPRHFGVLLRMEMCRTSSCAFSIVCCDWKNCSPCEFIQEGMMLWDGFFIHVLQYNSFWCYWSCLWMQVFKIKWTNDENKGSDQGLPPGKCWGRRAGETVPGAKVISPVAKAHTKMWEEWDVTESRCLLATPDC